MASKKTNLALVRDAKPSMRELNDSLINFLNSLGTSKDPTTGYLYALNEIDRSQLNNAYRGSWLAKKIIDVPAKDATSKWRRWQADQADITKIEDVEKRFDLQRKIKRAMIRARLYGGAGLVIGVGDAGESKDPLDVERVKAGSLQFVHVMSKHELRANERITDPKSPWFGQPESYEITVTQAISSGGTLNQSEKIHPSRVVQLLGEEVPDTFLGSVDNWNADSVLQSCDEAIRGAGIVIGGIAALIGDMKFDIIGVPGLTSQMGDKDYKKRLLERFAVANMAKSICNTLLMDKEESWERIQTTLTGLPEVVRVYMELCGGASGIPVSRLIGPGQHGLGGSASGETDIANYYDTVTNEQETVVGPAMTMLDEVIIRSALGSADPSIYYAWTPLRELTEKQKADMAKVKADTAKVYSDTGLINEDVLRAGVVNQLIEDETFAGMEQAVQEYGAEPAAPPPQLDPAAALAAAAATKVTPGQAADAAPRTIYVRRDVLNADEIKTWANKQGFASTVPADQMHVTIIYSRSAIDWMKTGTDWSMSPGEEKTGNLTIPPGGARLVEKMGDAVALLFNSSRLGYRHEDFKRAGAESDYPEYQPHISLTFEPGDLNLAGVVPYRGEIRLGPEIFEQVNDSERWRDSFAEDAAYTASRGKPMTPAKTAKRKRGPKAK
jgi:phage-related protein (TIGR01555 family)